MPPSVTVRRRPDDTGHGSPAQEAALRTLACHLLPGDSAGDAHGFIATAAARAFPLPPTLREMSLGCTYAYEPESYHSFFNPNNGDGKPWLRWRGSRHGEEYTGPLLILTTRRHAYVELRPIVESVHARHPEVAVWLLHLINELPGWVIRPRWWREFIERAFWCGDSDESEAVANDGPGEIPPEDERHYPLKKEVDALFAYPFADAIAGKRSAALVSGGALNLRHSTTLRRLGIDVAGLLDESGQPLAHDPATALVAPCNEAYEPVTFSWGAHDWVLRAIDSVKQDASNCGDESAAFAWLPADQPTRRRTHHRLAHTYRLLAGLDRFCATLIHYAKHHAKNRTLVQVLA